MAKRSRVEPVILGELVDWLVVAIHRIVGVKKSWRRTCEQSHCSRPLREHSVQNYLPARRWVLKAPELWRGGFEAKANFDPTALLLT